MLHSRACRHCAGQFRQIRTGHFFCSDTCRKLSHKAKNRAKTQAKRNRKLSEKLKKLANGAFGQYLVKEIKRAGTVEVLQGQNSESLASLVSLRRRCTAAGGYEKGESLGYYELSHIYPVSGKDRLGLLNSANLVITPKTFNRKHGTKLPIEGYMGSSIPRTSLLKQWKVTTSLESLEVLKLARRYIGEEFDIWLKKHLISQTQKQAILKKFKEAGYDYQVLKTMELRQLKAMADEEEIPYFSIDKDPNEEIYFLGDELLRLGINNHISKQFDYYWSVYESFGDSNFNGSEEEENKFISHLVEQALLCLHGQPFIDTWKEVPFETYFKSNREKVEIDPEIIDDDDMP